MPQPAKVMMMIIRLQWCSLDSNEFLSNPSGITSQETFLAFRYYERVAKNPLFELISLVVPTAPYDIMSI